MLTLSTNDKVYLCANPIDFRVQINGLMMATQNIIKQNPHSRAYFVFVNKKRTSLKIFQFNGVGYWMHLVLMAEGKFKWPQNINEESITMTPTELQILLMGGDYQKVSLQTEWPQSV